MMSSSTLSIALLCLCFLVPLQVQGWVVSPHHSPLPHQCRNGQTTTQFFLSINESDPEDEDDNDYGYDEETARNPTQEIAKIKQKIEQAKEEGDMDTVMTLMGTLLALGGAYDTEA